MKVDDVTDDPELARMLHWSVFIGLHVGLTNGDPPKGIVLACRCTRQLIVPRWPLDPQDTGRRIELFTHRHLHLPLPLPGHEPGS
jgi:hypothetical protein